jgi:hypothetical protein
MEPRRNLSIPGAVEAADEIEAPPLEAVTRAVWKYDVGGVNAMIDIFTNDFMIINFDQFLRIIVFAFFKGNVAIFCA